MARAILLGVVEQFSRTFPLPASFALRKNTGTRSCSRNIRPSGKDRAVCLQHPMARQSCSSLILPISSLDVQVNTTRGEPICLPGLEPADLPDLKTTKNDSAG